MTPMQKLTPLATRTFPILIFTFRVRSAASGKYELLAGATKKRNDSSKPGKTRRKIIARTVQEVAAEKRWK
jgi:hypothetical protein